MTVTNIDLSSANELNLSDNKKIVFDQANSSVSFTDDAEFIWKTILDTSTEWCFLLVCYSKPKSLLVLDEYGTDVFLFDLANSKLHSIFRLNRSEEDDAGLFRSQFFDTNFGGLLVYEGGVVLFTYEGQVTWSAEFKTIDILMSKIDDQVVWFESEFSESFGYELDSGKKVSV